MYRSNTRVPFLWHAKRNNVLLIYIYIYVHVCQRDLYVRIVFALCERNVGMRESRVPVESFPPEKNLRAHNIRLVTKRAGCTIIYIYIYIRCFINTRTYLFICCPLGFLNILRDRNLRLVHSAARGSIYRYIIVQLHIIILQYRYMPISSGVIYWQ